LLNEQVRGDMEWRSGLHGPVVLKNFMARIIAHGGKENNLFLPRHDENFFRAKNTLTFFDTSRILCGTHE